jgi:methylenetetrahydrofolate--tRNA-(uracil-5-)-methyltransferase
MTAAESKTVTVVGGGLAGAEAAFQLAKRGFAVRLIDMKLANPPRFSPAHGSADFAELVCSNSLKSADVNTASGLLKAEMKLLGSLIIEAAEQNSIPAGGALAVDREHFAHYITQKLRSFPNIEFIGEEIVELPQENAIVCTGPLTSPALAEDIRRVCGGLLSFYDAAAPIVTAESIDMSRVFAADRYGKAGADYINCPMDKDGYERFFAALQSAERVVTHENKAVFEGCMPVEVLASRGIDTLRFGCMKPVGLIDPSTGKRPHAAVQLRRENAAGTMFNLVGFQTNLKFGEQKRVFSMIPGLENAEFVRFGVMHKNIFIDSPRLLDGSFRLKTRDKLYFAGQITGTEGYCESAMGGLVAALAFCGHHGIPRETMIGALCAYISDETVKHFQPMGAAMGLLPGLEQKIRDKRARYAALSARATDKLSAWMKANNI